MFLLVYLCAIPRPVGDRLLLRLLLLHRAIALPCLTATTHRVITLLFTVLLYSLCYFPHSYCAITLSVLVPSFVLCYNTPHLLPSFLLCYSTPCATMLLLTSSTPFAILCHNTPSYCAITLPVLLPFFLLCYNSPCVITPILTLLYHFLCYYPFSYCAITLPVLVPIFLMHHYYPHVITLLLTLI